jgi:hypothetical protein
MDVLSQLEVCVSDEVSITGCDCEIFDVYLFYGRSLQRGPTCVYAASLKDTNLFCCGNLDGVDMKTALLGGHFQLQYAGVRVLHHGCTSLSFWVSYRFSQDLHSGLVWLHDSSW